jgi:hypothetical protein
LLRRPLQGPAAPAPHKRRRRQRRWLRVGACVCMLTSLHAAQVTSFASAHLPLLTSLELVSRPQLPAINLKRSPFHLSCIRNPGLRIELSFYSLALRAISPVIVLPAMNISQYNFNMNITSNCQQRIYHDITSTSISPVIALPTMHASQYNANIIITSNCQQCIGGSR